MKSKRITIAFIIFVGIFTLGTLGYILYETFETESSETYIKIKDDADTNENPLRPTIEGEFVISSGHVIKSTAIDESFILNSENGNVLSIYVKNEISNDAPFHVHIYKNGQSIHMDELNYNEISLYTRKIKSNATYKIQFDSSSGDIPFSAYLEVKQYNESDVNS